jgi:hypothetical protein
VLVQQKAFGPRPKRAKLAEIANLFCTVLYTVLYSFF